MISFLASTTGRWIRIVIGIVLLVGGFCWGPMGFIACVVGILFISFGASDTCLIAGWLGRGYNGSDIRR